MYSLSFHNGQFEIFAEGMIMATAQSYWDKLPLVTDGFLDIKKRKQIYITDVVSNKIGYGSILIDEMLRHFGELKTSKPKNGYSKENIWLKVLKNNERAFFLYKKFGFEISTIIDDEYIWMYKIL